MANTSDFKNGLIFNHKGNLWKIVEFLHVKPGKGGAFVRSKLKNIKTGQVVEETFRAGEKIETIRIEARNYNIRFSCDADGVMRRIVDFGEEVDEESSNDDDSKYLDEKKDYYNEIFEAGQLSRITKLSGLSNSMQIYPKMGLPLLFKSNIGGLGKIEVYIKSKTQIEKESYQISNTDNV